MFLICLLMWEIWTFHYFGPIYWIQKAADQGYDKAELELGLDYDLGNGMPQDESQAAVWYGKAAAQGNADAETSLGGLYTAGTGVEQNYALAAVWLQKAVDQGDAIAEDALGKLYNNGTGETQDYGQAAQLWEEAADQGQSDAQYNLGNLYYNGQGVPQDYAKAAKYYQESADQGCSDAQFNLGAMYLNGQGVSADDGKAVSLFYQSARQNDANAEDALGQLYATGNQILDDGQIMPRSSVLAYMMFNLAVAQANPGSKDLRDKISASMTPGQISDAQAMSSKWVVGTPLPRDIPYEDWAPDFVFNSVSTTSDVYQASRIWFSREFTDAGKKEYAVFMVTTGDGSHASAGSISVATFDESKKPGDFEFEPSVQQNFTQVGSYGDVEPLRNPNAPYASPDRLDAPDFDLEHGHYAILVPDQYSGMGETDQGYEIFLFDAGTNGWADAGGIATHDDIMGDCNNQDSDGSPPCYSWTGEVSLIPATGSPWPEFVVHRHGTALDASNKVIPARDVIYRYDGKQYSSLPARVPAS